MYAEAYMFTFTRCDIPEINSEFYMRLLRWTRHAVQPACNQSPFNSENLIRQSSSANPLEHVPTYEPHPFKQATLSSPSTTSTPGITLHCAPRFLEAAQGKHLPPNV